jgi:hypothetical protein
MFLDELDPRLMERLELVYGSFASHPKREDAWSWEQGYDEPAIEVDEHGEYKKGSKYSNKKHGNYSSTTVWKSSGGTKKRK